MHYEREWTGKTWVLVPKGFYGDEVVSSKEDLIDFANNLEGDKLYGLVYARLAVTTSEFITSCWSEYKEVHFIRDFIEHEVNAQLGNKYSNEEFDFDYPEHWVYDAWIIIEDKELPEDEEKEEMEEMETNIVRDIFLAILNGIEKYIKDDPSVTEFYYSKEYSNRYR